jgi:hypothetical protein
MLDQILSIGLFDSALLFYTIKINSLADNTLLINQQLRLKISNIKLKSKGAGGLGVNS